MAATRLGTFFFFDWNNLYEQKMIGYCLCHYTFRIPTCNLEKKQFIVSPKPVLICKEHCELIGNNRY